MHNQPLAYAIVVVPSRLPGLGIFVTCRDLPELLSFGLNEGQALEVAAEDMALILGTYESSNQPVPEPSPLQDRERLLCPARSVRKRPL